MVCLHDDPSPESRVTDITTTISSNEGLDRATTRKYGSSVSVVSIEDGTTVGDNDDDDYLTTLSDDDDEDENDAYEPAPKKIKYSQRTVSFMMDVSPIDSISVRVSSDDDDIASIFWSREDLRRIQTDAKMMYAMDPDVRDYAEAFHQIRERFATANLNNEQKERTMPLHELRLLQDGLSEGWRGLESCDPSYKVRQRQVRDIVRSIVSAASHSDHDDDDRLAQLAATLAAPAKAWAHMMGQWEHIANEDAETTSSSASSLRDRLKLV